MHDLTTHRLCDSGSVCRPLTFCPNPNPNPNHSVQEPPPSHIDAHWGRWVDGMAEGDFNRSHFRESSQWKALTREHAQIIDDDTFVLGRFFAKCPPDQQ